MRPGSAFVMNEPSCLFVDLMPCLGVARNRAASPLPILAASDFSDASCCLGFSPSDAETPPPNVYKPAPGRETQHFLDTAAHPTAHSTRDRSRPTAGHALRTSPAQTSPVPIDNRNHTRSCRCPDRFPCKCE